MNDVRRLPRPEKAVFRGTFWKLDPLTVVAKRPHEFGRKLVDFAAQPSLTKVPAMMWTALRS